ncbi:hypothetical protein N2152v2_005376 [Parachlorella kessleri]
MASTLVASDEQAPAAPSSLLPGSFLGTLATDDLLHYGLLSQTGCASVQQHLAEAPAPKQVLLDKLFTSLAALQDAKKAAGAAAQARAATPSPPSEACGPPAMRQSPFEVALLSQLSQLDLGAEASSPTGPLSREESLVSLPSSALSQTQAPTSHAQRAPHHQISNIPSAVHANMAGCRPPPPPARVAAGGNLLGAAGMAQQQCASHGAALAALNGQLLGSLPANMHPASVLPSPQLQQPCMPASYPLLMREAVAPAHALQYLQQQVLWQQVQQHQHQQAMAAALQQQQPEECLFISDEMNLVSQCLLAKLKMLQQADPVQGMWSKRFFCSIKEVSKVVHRAKCIIVAPDVKPNPAAHINPVRMLVQVLHCAELYGVPVVFALSRRGIGQVFGRDKSMSIVAVMSADQCQAEFGAMMQLSQQGRAAYLLQRGGLRHHAM